jgi:HEAT repeat protein
VNGHYLDDFSAVYATLAVLLQDDSEYVAEPAAAIINVLALMERTTEITPVSESATIRQALENVIAQGAHDTVRGRAIDAWVLMYPPDDAMVGTLEKILLGDMDRFPKSHAAAFRAFGIYKRRFNYPLPETTMTTAKQLLEHPSQAVRVKAEYALAELAGPSVLPTLIAQLKQAGNSSEGLMLTALILRLDNSQDTIDQLNRITAEAQR